jgi:hypothetical protein
MIARRLEIAAHAEVERAVRRVREEGLEECRPSLHDLRSCRSTASSSARELPWVRIVYALVWHECGTLPGNTRLRGPPSPSRESTPLLARFVRGERSERRSFRACSGSWLTRCRESAASLGPCFLSARNRPSSLSLVFLFRRGGGRSDPGA